MGKRRKGNNLLKNKIEFFFKLKLSSTNQIRPIYNSFKLYSIHQQVKFKNSSKIYEEGTNHLKLILLGTVF